MTDWVVSSSTAALGAGQEGTVYRATDARGRKAAVKAVKTASASEAKAAVTEIKQMVRLAPLGLAPACIEVHVYMELCGTNMQDVALRQASERLGTKNLYALTRPQLTALFKLADELGKGPARTVHGDFKLANIVQAAEENGKASGEKQKKNSGSLRVVDLSHAIEIGRKQQVPMAGWLHRYITGADDCTRLEKLSPQCYPYINRLSLEMELEGFTVVIPSSTKKGKATVYRPTMRAVPAAVRREWDAQFPLWPARRAELWTQKRFGRMEAGDSKCLQSCM